MEDILCSLYDFVKGALLCVKQIFNRIAKTQALVKMQALLLP